MTPADMADALRALGWTVTPPGGDVAVPEPQVGQVWRAANPRAVARTVAQVDDDAIHAAMQVLYLNATYPTHGQYTSRAEFRRWAIRTGARPVTP